MDRRSWNIWVGPMKNKTCSDFVRVLKDYQAFVRTSFNVELRTVLADSDTVALTVTAVNDAPTLAAIALTGTEDTTFTFTAADFTGAYADSESTPLASITVATLPATGTLKLSGTNVTANQVIPAANLGNLTYVPAANENGAKTFTFKFDDLAAKFAEWEKGMKPALWKRQDARTETATTPKKGTAKAGNRVAEALKTADKDNDGKLTREEYPQKDLFDAVDANKDGFATLEEVQTYYRNRRGTK
jgi:hypothetical protein